MQKEEINTILFSRHSSVKCSKGNNISVWENIPTLQKYFLALLKSKLRPVLVYFMKKIYIYAREMKFLQWKATQMIKSLDPLA